MDNPMFEKYRAAMTKLVAEAEAVPCDAYDAYDKIKDLLTQAYGVLRVFDVEFPKGGYDTHYLERDLDAYKFRQYVLFKESCDVVYNRLNTAREAQFARRMQQIEEGGGTV